MTTPNVEERLSAAAFTILTDGQPHAIQAQRWAVRYLRVAARGSETEFLRKLRPQRFARARAFDGAGMEHA